MNNEDKVKVKKPFLKLTGKGSSSGPSNTQWEWPLAIEGHQP